LSDTAVREITWSAGFLHGALDNKPDQERILNAIQKLETNICEGAATIAKIQEDEKATAERWKLVRKWALGIGGVTLIVADGASSAPSGGAAAASFVLGGAIVGAALAE
jgi:hypothetical protein